MRKISLIIVFALLLLLALFAQVPRTMNYQGKLTNSAGVALNGTDTIAFFIYDTSEAGTALWGETLSVNIVNGLFEVQLGNTHPINLDFSEPYWMELSISTDGGTTWETFSPREKLAPVSFAYRSIYADTAEYASGSGGGVPSQAYVAFPDSSSRTGWTYTGCYETKCSGDSWSTKTSMPTARRFLAAAAVNGKIYAIGGDGSSSYLSTNEEYDPITDSWTTRASMPTGRQGLAAAAVSGKIYAIGGRNAGGFLSTNQEYDPSTDSWTTKASMPTAREDLAAAAVNGKIYAIGGYNDEFIGDIADFLRNNEEYDPETDSWTTKASMSTRRKGLAAAVVNGKIYAIGGYNIASGHLSTNEEYNPSTNSWTTKTSMPTARQYLAAAAMNGKIYAIGGDGSSGQLSTNREYDPNTDSWTTRASMPTARYGLAAAAVNRKIYAIGGRQGGSNLSNNEEYTPPLVFYWFQKD